MNRFLLFFFVSGALVLHTLFLPGHLFAADGPDSPERWKQQWKRVENAEAKGLPKSALEYLAPIIQQSKSAGRDAELIRAIYKRVELEAQIQGGKPFERITRLEKAIETAADSIKPTLRVLLANTYWQHFKQNRWRYQQRTQIEDNAADDSDINTWGLKRILGKVDQVFQSALADADRLKLIPVQQYSDLLEKGTVSDAYRPTLYDVIAHNALVFYSAGEQGLSRPRDFFEPTAESPFLSDAGEFLRWIPETTDTASAALKAIRLYQAVLQFHTDDDDKSAFADTDLLRIIYANATAVGNDKTNRYRAALNRFIDLHQTHEVSALASHSLAVSHQQSGDLVLAREIADKAAERHPQSIGGVRCRNLIHQIESKELLVSTERVWQNSIPVELKVDYKNITEVHFRLVPFDLQGFLTGNRSEPYQLNDRDRDAILRRPSIKSWSAKLAPTEDFQPRTQSIAVPNDVPKGSYLLVSCSDKSWQRKENQLSVTEVCVSDLSFLQRKNTSEKQVEGFVVDAVSGVPLANVSVEYWVREGNQSRRKKGTELTDRNGYFRVPVKPRERFVLLAKRGGDVLMSGQSDSYYPVRTQKAVEATRLFTDRAIYRPGQTIHYKGITHLYYQPADRYETIKNRRVTVALFDANGQEVERFSHRTNAFGSFSGSVTAPADRLTGRMSLRVVNGPRGQASVRVEQYKRPKFKAEVQAPEVAAKLNGLVSLKAKATAYSGAPIDDASVSWRVVRKVHYPGWWFRRCWWMPVREASQEIAKGRGQVDANGAFEIQFEASPDESVPRESEPTFRYTIYADITDATGETRSSSRTINVGYTALAASVSADEWLVNSKPVDLTIRTKTLDGVGQAALGTLRVYRVEQPESVARKELVTARHKRMPVDASDIIDLSKPQSWKLGPLVQSLTFETSPSGGVDVSCDVLPVGIYRVLLETADRFGKKATAQVQFHVLDPTAAKMVDKLPEMFVVETNAVEPGEEFRALWGSGYETARALIEIEHRGKTLQRYWTDGNRTQQLITQPINESMRGGLVLRTTMFKENRVYSRQQRIEVPWSNKQLTVKWEHFVSKLEPGQKETWRATIVGPKAKKHAAEMVATLYDASLDAFQTHQWPSGFSVFRRESGFLRNSYSNLVRRLRPYHQQWESKHRAIVLQYPRLPPAQSNGFGFRAPRMRADGMMGMEMSMMSDGAVAEGVAAAPGNAFLATATGAFFGVRGQDKSNVDRMEQDLSSVAIRENLNETAFFFPHLETDESGSVTIEFTMPESLTEWKFMAFAHDTELRGGLLTDTAVTQKDIMVEPNPPRFVREGDELEFTVKISNLSPTRQTGTARLNFLDARTEASVDRTVENVESDKSFAIPAGASETVSWRLKIPANTNWMIYRAVASTGKISDGQQDFLPVLSSRVLVTESISLPIRGAGRKTFEFDALRDAEESGTLQHRSLSVQMTSNPAWYAVMALPYLMEDPYQCNEQTFNRLYANSLASHIAGNDRKIQRVFQQWRGKDALKSSLEKNEDLKSVMLQETPWLRQGNDESAARRNVGNLFDLNRLASEQVLHSKKLAQSQLPSGGWSWFPGGRANDYITLYIASGFGRLRHLGVEVELGSALKAARYLDGRMRKRYEDLPVALRGNNHLASHVALYLYMRSFFMKDAPISDSDRQAFDYWRGQAIAHCMQTPNRQSQAHLALALHRLGNRSVATGIMDSIKERSVSDEEMGMFWRDTERSLWWYRAPIETQAMMIEAFDEVSNDVQAVKDCKVWLLKQKQTQDWTTTKATADAVYALLLRGTDILRSNELVTTQLGDQVIRPASVEAGTGFYEKRFSAGEVSPSQSEIVITKRDEGVAWGSVHWQYLEEVGNLKSHVAGPMTLTKQYFVKQNTERGPALTRVQGPVAVGDELVARIVLKTDRDMEYVHLKDHRGSGTEPVSVLSGYRYQDGLAYYESTQDTASHYFIDYLPKGTYVFEYSVRVQHRGVYETGMANIQCMYAPEFNSHSESVRLQVR